jgi:cytochrome c5
VAALAGKRIEMKKRISAYRIIAVVALTEAAIRVPGYRLYAVDDTSKQRTASAATSPENVQKSGEQIFMENCSRCHKPPMTISPRITGTIVMHMRVRAKLSREGENAVLRYLAP